MLPHSEEILATFYLVWRQKGAYSITQPEEILAVIPNKEAIRGHHMMLPATHMGSAECCVSGEFEASGIERCEQEMLRNVRFSEGESCHCGHFHLQFARSHSLGRTAG